MIHHCLTPPSSFSLFLNPPRHSCGHHKSGLQIISTSARVSTEVIKVEQEEKAEEEEIYAPHDGIEQIRPWPPRHHVSSNGSLQSPWKKDSTQRLSVKPRSNFRPAPWQQASGLGHELSPWKQRPIETKEKIHGKTLDEELPESNKEYDNGRSALAEIVEKLRNLQYSSQYTDEPTFSKQEEACDSASFPWERRIENGTKKEEEISLSSSSSSSSIAVEIEEEDRTNVACRNRTRADILIPSLELKRLRLLSIPLLERLKIGKLGVTKSIVRIIRQQWIISELVKVRCHGPAANSIKKILSDLEKSTGGLVVWRDKNVIAIYRGTDYNVENGSMMSRINNGTEESGIVTMNGNNVCNLTDGKGDEKEMESEGILEGLGPRYEKWTGLRPIPIDGDLLPPEVPNYRPPFRLLPFGVRGRLSDAELTNLRRLARPIAPHFVLARNKGHQGLAVAMLKLWEKTEIVKIAVKKRTQNTNNELMANEIRRLTDGVLLSRNKFFMTFYRGKDFVPQSVATTLSERELIFRDLQEEEEKARNEKNIFVKRPPSIQPSVAAIRPELPDVKPSWVHTMDIRVQNILKQEVAKLHKLTIARQLEKKLDRSLKKKVKAEQDLVKVEAFMKPIERPTDVETITEEERFMYRKLGIRMKSTLLLGVRGVFDGIVENMHLHWKHRELVKLVVHESDPVQLQETARMLEYESGGILISIIRSPKDNIIIMYRGKNYERPSELRPRNLLTKRKALKRAIEMQRRASLLQNVQALETEILQIKGDLHKMESETVDNDQIHSVSEAESASGLRNRAWTQPLKIKDEHGDERKPSEEEVIHHKTFRDRIKKLEKLVSLGPIHRADPLTNTERLKLSKKALSLNKTSQFFVGGRSNDLDRLASGIRVYFLHHALVKIVMKDQDQGASSRDLLQSLENLTGGVAVSEEGNEIIMYRGWPEGGKIPRGSLLNISPELRAALEVEEGDWDDDLIQDDRISNEVCNLDDEGSDKEGEYVSDANNDLWDSDGMEDDDDDDDDDELLRCLRLDDNDKDIDQ